MIDGRVIRGVDASSSTFVKTLGRIKEPKLQEQIRETLKSLLFLQLDQVPRKLHLHQLTNKMVASVTEPGKKVAAWSLHVTADDRYKASFTLEDSVVYLRLCDEHDVIDKNP